MVREQLFIVSKIEKTNRHWGDKVFLFDRMLNKGEHQFFTDIISSRALRNTWNFELGDVVSCIPNGSITLRNDNRTLHFWLPITMHSKTKKMIIGKELDEDGCRKSTTGELIDTTITANRALLDEEWECIAIEVRDNNIVWFPRRRLSRITADIKSVNGEIRFCIKKVSGDKDLSVEREIRPIIDSSVICVNGETIIREQYMFPVHQWSQIHTDDGEVFSLSDVPELAGCFIVDKRIEEKEHEEYVDTDNISGYFIVDQQYLAMEGKDPSLAPGF